MKIKTLTLLVAFGLSLLSTTPALAHGVDLPKPTADELKQTQPPLAGSANFARELLGHIRNQLAQTQLVLLDSVLEQFAAADRIRAGEAHDATPADAAYHHWRAEQSLLKLLSEAPDLIALDFRQGSPTRHPDTALNLDSQFNLLLLKVVTGSASTNFVIHEMNMTTERDPKPYRFNIVSNATTFVLVKLEQVPSDKTIFPVSFQHEGAKEPSFWWAMSFVTKPGGQLAKIGRASCRERVCLAV